MIMDDGYLADTMIDLMMDYDGYYGYMMLRLIMDDGSLLIYDGSHDGQ